MKYGLIAFIMAIWIGYAPTWSAYYLAKMMGEEKIKILGSLSNFAIPCTSSPTKNSYCTSAYLIPSELYDKWGEQAAIGFGQIISASRYKCLESKFHYIDVDDPSNPGRSFDIFTTYQTLTLSTLGCKKGVIVEAWSRNAAIRKGYLSGTTAVVGHFSAVESVKKLTEFFTAQFLFALSMSFLILMLMSERLYRYSDSKMYLHPYEVTLPIWFLNSLLISGIGQTFFAFIQTPVFFNRAAMFLTHVSLALIPILIVRKKITNTRGIVTISTSLFFIFACVSFSSLFAKLFMPINFFILFATLLIVIWSLDFEYIFLLAAAVLSCLKIDNYDGMPAEYIIYIFYAFAVTFIILSKIRINSRLAALTQWVQSSTWRKSSDNLLQVLVRKLHQEVGARRTTLLSVSQEGQIKIYSLHKSGEVVEMIRDELPPIFAHAFSTGEPLIHLDSKSDKYRHIARGALPRVQYANEHFTILPIRSESRVMGAIAFTEYPKKWVKSATHTFLMRHLTRTMESTFIEQIHAQDWRNIGSWSEKLLEIQKQLPEAMSLTEAHHVICKSLNCFGFLAALDEKSRQFTIHAIEGYPSEVSNRLENGKIFAHRENEQGPIALAANQERSIIVPDVKLLRGVLHENSNLFFEKSGTQSCAAIPVYASSSTEKKKSLWGILFLERSTDDVFTFEAKKALEQISAEITELLVRFDHERVSDQTLKALTNFVPEHVVDRVIHNNLEREEDRGMLMMIDLKGSTKLALKVGSEAWLNRARTLAKPMEEIAKRYGLCWQYFQWDAFYFTRSAASPNSADLRQVLLFFEEAYTLIRSFYVEHYSEFGDFSNEAIPVARACISFGDISRGFQEGATRSWTIVGNEMSAISKFEDLCKRIEGIIFVDESLQAVLDSSWLDTGVLVPSTGRKIYKSILLSDNHMNRAA